MSSSSPKDEIAELLFNYERRIAALENASQLGTSTVGDDASTAADVADVVTDAVVANAAIPTMQDDAADSSEAVTTLQALLAASQELVDARLADGAQDLADAGERLEASQREIEAAFDERVDGLSDDVDTAITRAGNAVDAAEDAKSAAVQAGSKASDAQNAAEDANRAALEAAGVAAGKGTVYAQPSAPDPVDPNGLWIDTDDGNKPYRGAVANQNQDPPGVVTIASPLGAEQVIDGMTLTGLPSGLTLAVNVSLYLSMALNGVVKNAIARVRDGGLAGTVVGTYTFTDKGDSTDGDAERWDFGAYYAPTTSTLVVTIESGNGNGPDVFASRRLIAASGSGWVPVPDATIAAAADSAAQAAQKAIDATDAAERARQAAVDAANAAEQARQVADAAKTAAATAKSAADDANAQALTAAGIANGKGKVIYQVSKPTGANAAVGNLWIRTTDNTPWAYDGSDWVQVTDKNATDAAAKAAQAQLEATAAANAAAAAQATADAKPQILFSSTAGPSGTAPTGTIWFLWDAVKNVAGQWLQSGTLAAPVWTPQQIRSEVIANLDVAKLTAGSAAIAELVAQKIAASTANFQTANVSNLFVTQGATLSQAVIDFLFANVVQAKKITAGMIDVGSLNGVVLTGAILQTSATGNRVSIEQRSIGGTMYGQVRFLSASYSESNQAGASIAPASSMNAVDIWSLGDGAPVTSIGSPLRRGAGGRDAASTVSISTQIVEADTQVSTRQVIDYGTGFVLLDDSQWVDIVPASGYTFDNTRKWRARRIGQEVEIAGQVTRTASGNIAAGGSLGQMPAGMFPSVPRDWMCAGNGSAWGRVSISTTGVISVGAINGTTTYLICDPIRFSIN